MIAVSEYAAPTRFWRGGVGPMGVNPSLLPDRSPPQQHIRCVCISIAIETLAANNLIHATTNGEKACEYTRRRGITKSEGEERRQKRERWGDGRT